MIMQKQQNSYENAPSPILVNNKRDRRSPTFIVRIGFYVSLLLLLPRFTWAGTVLGDLAAQMQPGTWRDITSSVSGFSGALLDATTGGHINEYADKGVWNPLTREAWYAGGAHCGGSSCSGTDKFIRYTEAINTWSEISARPATTGHSYQHNAIDPVTGDLYYRNYNSKRVQRFRNGSWSDITAIPTGNYQVAGALEGFPERQGLIFVDGDWGVWSYAIASNSWTLLAETNGGQGTSLFKARMGAYHNVAVYNPIYKIILFGGGNGSAALYRINQSGTITTETTAPTSVSINSTIFTVDPASGDYLLFSNSRGFWKYNPTTKSWISIPSNQHPPFFNSAADGPALGTVAFPISTYGVIMFTTWNHANSKVYLYKHAPTSSAPLPPTAPTTLTIN